MGIEIVTKADLELFRINLINDLKKLINTEKKQQVEWLRSRDVRELLGISPGTLQSLRISGKLPFTKIGSILYYRASSVQELLEDGK